MKAHYSQVAAILPLAFVASGCDPMEELYSKINKAGYIPFVTPLSHSGPGTLVGGAPDRLSLVAGPDTCFPSEVDGQSTGLLQVDQTALPERTYEVAVSGKAKVGLANFLSSGNPMLGAGLNFNHVETVEMRMDGVHVEYLDSVRLTAFYNDVISDVCRQYLDKVGFIIQAMKVDKMEFKFYRKGGGSIELNLENLETIVDLEIGIDFTIEEGVKLVITSPKYIGYQLGRLRLADGGMALYRATRVKNKRFLFESLDVFAPPPGKDWRRASIASGILGSGSTLGDVYDRQDLVDPSVLQSIDRHATYLKAR